MPTMPLMIATFAYLNAKRFEPDTFVIDVRVSFTIWCGHLRLFEVNQVI